ncbi:hypothetical protein F0562_028367 [Nyssa sinensis]|uniref:Uncharacterized protein n=1 Tax=Nyssa sinensis TaxID=561372 RepID=A0A5J5B7Y6_9ASTE|nr:hypothetical protein F0562_028367 [Nyssa sinensis]
MAGPSGHRRLPTTPGSDPPTPIVKTGTSLSSVGSATPAPAIALTSTPAPVNGTTTARGCGVGEVLRILKDMSIREG